MHDDEVLIGGIEKVDINIVEYDDQWPHLFECHKLRVVTALGEKALLVEHIGSTSVPGLAAKPIIDMVVAVENAGLEEAYLASLIEAGYELRVREPEFHEHRMVRTPEKDVHIHIFSFGCREIERYLLLRNHLRANKEDRSEYELIKKKLVKESWCDMNAYAEAKTQIIERMLDANSIVN